ncbi:hypothetical protein [Nitratireductor soli]|uniref:hypothetical protein n=1 Tax=Nitratireductor soli TaxID=1670619 RepID=UPI000A43BF90|nr:hypothetical protein [Nitratireductor soli]
MVNKPTISVNKMAEYIVSRGARQRKILHDRKYPDPDFNAGIYHREVSEAVSRYITDGAIDTSPLDTMLHTLEQQTPEKIGTARRVNANIDALERFNTMLDDIDLMGAEAVLGAHNPAKLTFFNVEVSVRPEIVLRATAKGKSYVGAWKLHFSKTHPHTEESAGYVSAAVNEYCRLHLAGPDDIINPAFCQVIDVASGTVFPGVKATKQRLNDIEAECQNIAALWPSI